MVDFHTHILPGIDDGAESIDESLSMLRSAYEDGIDTVVSTSHIYIEKESDIDAFLSARNAVYNELKTAMVKDGGKFPEIKLGCEVHLKKNIDDYNSLTKLAIEGTDFILIEMPYSGWRSDMYESVYNISVMGVKPVMAHIERFLKYRSEFHNLKSVGALFQVNADAFLHKSMRKELLDLYSDGYIHVLGSDMHNTVDRTNNLREAYEIIKKCYGNAYAEYTENNARKLLDNKMPGRERPPKLGFFKKIIL